MKNRREVLRLLGDLPAALTATDAEVLEFIERRALVRQGVGYIDAHLLASAAPSGSAQLWTHDGRLASIAADLKLAYFAK